MTGGQWAADLDGEAGWDGSRRWLLRGRRAHLVGTGRGGVHSLGVVLRGGPGDLDGSVRLSIDGRHLRVTDAEAVAFSLDQRASRAAFMAAGGPGATAPQCAASAVSWIGLGLLPLVVLAGADGRAWLLGLEPLAGRLRGGLEAWLFSALGTKDVEGMAALLSDPRLLAALLALLGGLAGIASAWRHRAALARGFAAAEAGVPGATFATRRYGEAAPFLLIFMGMRPVGGDMLVPNALVLCLVAHLAAGGLTAMAERRAAGLGWHAAAPSSWDAATMAASLGALLLLLGHVLGLIG